MLLKSLRPIQRILLLVLELCASLLQYAKEWLHFWRLASRFPAPHPFTIFPNMLERGRLPSATKIIDCIDDIILHYRTGRYWIGPVNIFFINDPRDLQCYLQNIKNQIKPFHTNTIIGEAMGHGLISENGEKWRLHHKIISPSFHPDHLNTFIGTFSKQADIFVELLRKYANGQPIDVKSMTNRVSFDGVLETIIGIPSSQQTYPDTELFQAIDDGQEELCYRVIRPWLHLTFIYNLSSSGRRMRVAQKLFRKFCEQVVQQRMDIIQAERNAGNEPNQIKKGKKQCCGLIDALLQHKEAGEPISHADILDETQTIILAGFDTVAVTVQLALYSLARHPEFQENVFSELRNLFGLNGSAEITPDTLQHMKYLDMVIKETHRMYPPSWGHLRETGIDTPLVSCDLVVPKGSTVMISPKTLHRDPELYPEPEKFDPERFSPENCARRHPYAFLPFSRGQRSCIAKKFSMMEAKIIISKIIWNYELQPDPTYVPAFTWGIATVPTNGVWLKFVNRRQEL